MNRKQKKAKRLNAQAHTKNQGKKEEITQAWDFSQEDYYKELSNETCRFNKAWYLVVILIIGVLVWLIS